MRLGVPKTTKKVLILHYYMLLFTIIGETGVLMKHTFDAYTRKDFA